jgi:hypothetical protein
MLLALIAHHDLECKQYDIITAFLNALIDGRVIYVEQSHGYHQGNWSVICMLLEALYGLKQSPLLWCRELKKYLS